MDKHLDNAKMLLRTVEAAREEQRTIEGKEETKRWRKIESPICLTDALARLTKNDLSDIRSNLGIRNASSLNKQALIELLSSQIPALLQFTLSQLDEARYGLLKRIADAGGKAFVSLEPREYEYFQLRGLAFTGTVDGECMIVMAQEVLDEFRRVDVPSLRTSARKHTEWLQISQGLVFYYGFLSTRDLIRMVEDYTGSIVDKNHYLNVLFEGIPYGYAIRAHADGFTNDDVIDVLRVKREHQSRPNVPFYRFPKAQLLRAGQPGFVDKSPAYKAFVDFLRRSYEIDVADAEDEADLCVYEIQTGESLGDIIAAITEEFEIPSMEVLQELTRHVAQLHNNTRQWFLKGHTPRELLPTTVASMRPLLGAVGEGKGQIINIATKKKVGRNEPCPCGSGQKFKKCCGR